MDVDQKLNFLKEEMISLGLKQNDQHILLGEYRQESQIRETNAALEIKNLKRDIGIVKDALLIDPKDRQQAIEAVVRENCDPKFKQHQQEIGNLDRQYQSRIQIIQSQYNTRLDIQERKVNNAIKDLESQIRKQLEDEKANHNSVNKAASEEIYKRLSLLENNFLQLFREKQRVLENLSQNLEELSTDVSMQWNDIQSIKKTNKAVTESDLIEKIEKELETKIERTVQQLESNKQQRDSMTPLKSLPKQNGHTEEAPGNSDLNTFELESLVTRAISKINVNCRIMKSFQQILQEIDLRTQRLEDICVYNIEKSENSSHNNTALNRKKNQEILNLEITQLKSSQALNGSLKRQKPFNQTGGLSESIYSINSKINDDNQIGSDQQIIEESHNKQMKNAEEKRNTYQEQEFAADKINLQSHFNQKNELLSNMPKHLRLDYHEDEYENKYESNYNEKQGVASTNPLRMKKCLPSQMSAPVQNTISEFINQKKITSEIEEAKVNYDKANEEIHQLKQKNKSNKNDGKVLNKKGVSMNLQKIVTQKSEDMEPNEEIYQKKDQKKQNHDSQAPGQEKLRSVSKQEDQETKSQENIDYDTYIKKLTQKKRAQSAKTDSQKKFGTNQSGLKNESVENYTQNTSNSFSQQNPILNNSSSANNMNYGVQGLMEKKREKSAKIEADMGNSSVYSKQSRDNNSGVYSPRELNQDFGRNSYERRQMGGRLSNQGLQNSKQKQLISDLPPLNQKSQQSIQNISNQYSKPSPPKKNNFNQFDQSNIYENKKRGQLQQQQAAYLDEQQGDQVVYQLDEDGFLMDEFGNYLFNEDGDYVRLSPQELENLREQNLIVEQELT